MPVNRWDASKVHLDRAAVLALEADDAHRLVTELSPGVPRDATGRRPDCRYRRPDQTIGAVA
ncbi:hypothetical protein REH65_29705 [Saccharopolyspora sp. ID03-671]|uniref:hypothetical protein n=1 Tax=Saccharopolyspora sp. ID03-671 TaxID=3073066 RepID=UPI00324EE5C1